MAFNAVMSVVESIILENFSISKFWESVSVNGSMAQFMPMGPKIVWTD